MTDDTRPDDTLPDFVGQRERGIDYWSHQALVARRRASDAEEQVIALRAALERIQNRAHQIASGSIETGAIGATQYYLEVARAALEVTRDH